MTPAEAAALLGIAAAFDNRKPDADAAKAWAVALDGLRFEDCRDAIVEHYKASSDWLMPQKVIGEVKRIRSKRIAAAVIEPPRDLDPDDTLAYRRALKAATRAAADGNHIDPPHIAAVPMPKALGQAMATFGQMPPTDHRTPSTTPDPTTATEQGA